MKSMAQFSERLKKILDIIRALISFVQVKFTVQVLVTEIETESSETDQLVSLNQVTDQSSSSKKKMQSQVHSDIELNSMDFGVLLLMVLLGTSINRQSELVNGLLGLKILHHQGRTCLENMNWEHKTLFVSHRISKLIFFV